MEQSHIITELLIILVVTAPIVFLFQKLKLPAIVGFLVAGVLLGPSVTGWITNKEDIEIFAEIGVVLLLFTIGLEFSLSNLKQLRKQMLIGGGLQLFLTGGSVFLVTYYFGWRPQEALILGFLLALSSTAIVFKLLMDRGEIRSPQGLLSAGILLFQDLCVVPMVLIIQTMGEGTQLPFSQAAFAIFRALLVVIGLWLILRIFLPRLLAQMARLRNRELFIIFTVLIVIGVAWITEKVGLSYALGAFLAGILLAESDYCHEVMAEISPIRNLLFSLFFISIGMLLDVTFIAGHVKEVVGFTLIAVVAKAIIIGVVVFFMTRSIRLSVLVGLTLAQVGEFSFVLAQVARKYDLIGFVDYQGFLCTSILSMIATPFAIKMAPRIALWVQETKPQVVTVKEREEVKKEGHAIILGFGVTGHNLARVLTETHIPFVIVDLQPDLIREAKDLNYDTIFGDATRREILEKAGIDQARILVIAVSDPFATQHILGLAHGMNEKVSIIVRTRHESEIDQYYQFGATQVISEEFETSVEIFSRVLEEFRVPRNITQLQVELVRQDRYSMLRGLSLSSETLANLPDILAKTVVETYVMLEKSPWVNKNLGDLQLKKKTGTLVISIVRNVISTTNPKSNFKLKAGDVIILVGSHAQLDAALSILNPLKP